MTLVAEVLVLGGTAAAESHAGLVLHALRGRDLDPARGLQRSVLSKNRGVLRRRRLGRPAIVALEGEGTRGATSHDRGDRVRLPLGWVDPWPSVLLENSRKAVNALLGMDAAFRIIGDDDGITPIPDQSSRYDSAPRVGLVDAAPAPALARLGGLHQRMPGLEVLLTTFGIGRDITNLVLVCARCRQRLLLSIRKSPCRLSIDSPSIVEPWRSVLD